MEPASIDDIFAFNESTRKRLSELAQGITPEVANSIPEGEKWSPAHVIEHLALTEASLAKVCGGLLKKAAEKGEAAHGELAISDEFKNALGQMGSFKAEAPEMVAPKGAMTIADSFAAMEETALHLKKIRQLFAEYDSSSRHFPHPYFGKLNAAEWLMLIGQHETRHIEQLKRILAALA
ncbi:MAG: DinB family protein [Acidobacteria bacterium]|nr:DinB family protein [Acidobacteriota bacterium]